MFGFYFDNNLLKRYALQAAEGRAHPRSYIALKSSVAAPPSVLEGGGYSGVLPPTTSQIPVEICYFKLLFISFKTSFHDQERLLFQYFQNIFYLEIQNIFFSGHCG